MNNEQNHDNASDLDAPVNANRSADGQFRSDPGSNWVRSADGKFRADPELSIGSVVTLKSGGIRMTVVSIQDDRVAVVWSGASTGGGYGGFGISYGLTMCRDSFPIAALDVQAGG